MTDEQENAAPGHDDVAESRVGGAGRSNGPAREDDTDTESDSAPGVPALRRDRAAERIRQARHHLRSAERGGGTAAFIAELVRILDGRDR